MGVSSSREKRVNCIGGNQRRVSFLKAVMKEMFVVRLSRIRGHKLLI